MQVCLVAWQYHQPDFDDFYPGHDGICGHQSVFANLKCGGILLIQIAVGSLYMFSVPRGYIDGFVSWCKQVIGLCLTTFLQATVLIAGLMVVKDQALLGLGLMLSAGEIPRIAGQFGLDTGTRANVMGGCLCGTGGCQPDTHHRPDRSKIRKWVNDDRKEAGIHCVPLCRGCEGEYPGGTKCLSVCHGTGAVPIAVHLMYPQFLDDGSPEDREAGLQMGIRVLKACDELWLCGDRVSAGMPEDV